MAPPRKRKLKAVTSPTVKESEDGASKASVKEPTVASSSVPAVKVFVVRVHGAAFPSGRIDFSGDLEPLAKRLKVGDRIFLQGLGDATGRARLVRVVGVSETKIDVEHSWGWSRGAEDPAAVLASLSLKAEPDVFSVLALSSVA